MGRHNWSSSALSMKRPMRWRTFDERNMEMTPQSATQETTYWSNGTKDSCDSWMFSSVYSKSNTQPSLQRGEKRSRDKHCSKAGATDNIEEIAQCPYCNREVLEGQESTVVTIFGLKWHNSCFRCDRCSRQLQTLGGFICLLNSPICLECYLAVNPKDQEGKSVLDESETSRRSCIGSLSVPDETYGSALSGSFPTELFRIVYFNESDSEALFGDKFVPVEQLSQLLSIEVDTSQDLGRHNSTPLLMYSKAQPSPDAGFTSFSDIIASDDDGFANRAQTQDSNIGRFHSALTGREAGVATFPRSDQDQLAHKPRQSSEHTHTGPSLKNEDLCTPTGRPDDELACLRRRETALVRKGDTPVPFRSILDEWQDEATYPSDVTFLILSDNTLRQRSHLTSLWASFSTNITSCVDTHATPKTLLDVSNNTCSTLVANGALPGFEVSDRRELEDQCLPHPGQEGGGILSGSPSLRNCAALKMLCSAALLLMALIFCIR